MSPQDILLENELVITMITQHGYVPHVNHGNFLAVVGALQLIDPNGNYCMTCPGTMGEIGRMAQVHLNAYKASLANEKAKFHKFPVQEPPDYKIPTYEVKDGEIHSINLELKDGTSIPLTPKKHKGRKPGSKNKSK